MATAAQLYAARNAGLKLAQVTQPYAQADIPLANEAEATARAAVKAAADQAIVAATAIGGSGAALPATQAIVANGATAPVKNSAGVAVPGTSTYTVAANAVTDVKLPATVAVVTSGASAIAATGTGTTVTFTVANGAITAITLS